jgi:hypothetical protein
MVPIRLASPGRIGRGILLGALAGPADVSRCGYYNDVLDVYGVGQRGAERTAVNPPSAGRHATEDTLITVAPMSAAERTAPASVSTSPKPDPDGSSVARNLLLDWRMLTMVASVRYR